MKRNATIIIQSNESLNRVRGAWARTEVGWLLSYDESDATELGAVRTELLLSSGRAQLTRTGAMRSSFCFDPCAPQRFLYETAWGSFSAEVVTHMLRERIGNHGGIIELRYTLTLGGSVSVRTLKIRIQTENV